MCAQTNINLPQSGRILLNATSEWRTFSFAGGGADVAWGLCDLAVDGIQVGSPQRMGEDRAAVGASATHELSGAGTMALTALSGFVSAGNHVVAVRCTDADADIDWSAFNLTALAILG